MAWQPAADWAKHKLLVLRAADKLGRSRGRMRLLDRLCRPAPPPLTPDLRRWESAELAAMWIGHATVLLRIAGMNVLTDPVFSSRIGLGLGLVTAGPARHIAPALPLEQLPPLDLVLVSHAHYDHLDRPTLVRLSKRLPVITSEHNSDLIRDLGFGNITELRWGESMQVGPLRITTQKVVHWGARTFYDTWRGFAAFLLEAGRRRVLFGGDSGYHQLFRAIGKVDLACVGLGGYNPYLHAHANPEQAWEMANHLRAEHILPMHHSVFRLSREPMHEPIERFLTAAGHDADRIVVHQVGGQWML